MERRAFQRTYWNFEAFLMCEDCGSIVTVINYSDSGMCAVSLIGFRPSTSAVEIYILEKDLYQKISGKIVRVLEMNDSSTTIGIAFLNPPIIINKQQY